MGIMALQEFRLSETLKEWTRESVLQTLSSLYNVSFPSVNRFKHDPLEIIQDANSGAVYARILFPEIA